MKSHYSDKLLTLIAIGFIAFTVNAKNAQAQTLTENSPLTFGQIAMTENSSAHQIRMLPSGSFNADPEYVFFSDPALGNYTIDGQTPNTTLTVNITLNPLVANGGGSIDFTLSSPFTRPNMVRTDATGSVTFEIGATLESDGSGTTYLDDRYEGTYTVTATP